MESTVSAKNFERLPKQYKYDYLVGPVLIGANNPNLVDPLVRSWNKYSIFISKKRASIVQKAKEINEEQMALNFRYLSPDEPKPCFFTDSVGIYL